MANPLKDTSVFRIEWKDEGRMCYAQIVTTYSRGGSVMAYHGYHDSACARAGGGGYDKTHTALSRAIAVITGRKAGSIDGGAGFHAVERGWQALGVNVEKII